MSINKHWILPEGFQEILPPHSNRLEHCRSLIIQTFNRYGYDIVHPPMLEYLDALTAGHGKYLDLSTFKVTDQKSGRMLGLRADITPQISRINAHYMNDSAVSRLSYIGQILLTGRNNVDVNREQMQFGAELYGSNSHYAEFEIIQLSLNALSALEISNLRLTIGNMGVLRHFIDAMIDGSMALDADNKPAHHSSSALLLKSERREIFYDILKRRSTPDAEKFIASYIDDKKWIEFWSAYLSLIGDSQDIFSQLIDVCTRLSIELPDALAEFKSLVELVSDTHPEISIQVDMALLHNYDYHTGLIFYIYNPKLNNPLIKGGRYDGVDSFGAPLPAIGFSADLYQLLSITSVKSLDSHVKKIKAMAPDDVHSRVKDSNIFQSFQQAIVQYRQEGHIVIVQLPEQQAKASARHQYSDELCYIDGHWQLKSLQ